MGRVSTEEDIMAEVKEAFPEVDPKLLDNIFKATIDYIHYNANKPEVYSISLGKYLGRMVANYHMGKFSKNKACKERCEMQSIRTEHGTRYKIFSKPYLPSIIAKLNNAKIPYSLAYDKYLEMYERASYETNKKFMDQD